MHISDLEKRGSGTTVKEGLSTQLSVLIGLGVLSLVGLAFVSLSSWSVSDPSLSYANGKLAENTLGFTGAAFSDLAIQFFGLASALALVPPALWGWAKLLQRNIPNFGSRIVFWPLSMIVASGLFACFAIPNSWPLPLGLGGVTGDMVLKVPSLVIGGVNGFWAFLAGTILLVATLWLTLAASGLIWNLREVRSDELSEELVDSLVNEDEDAPSWLLGAFSHYYYVARMKFSSGKSSSQDFEEFESEPRAGFVERVKNFHRNLLEPENDGLEQLERGQAPDMAAEPTMEGPIVDGPDYGENVYNQYDEQAEREAVEAEWDPQPAPAPVEYEQASAQAPNVPQGRVQASAPAPKPSTRTKREAQPSLISMGDFELPSLHFLQETPPITAEMQLSQEALEQNARLLEGVLEDFGVKGEIINVRPGPVVTLYELEPAPGIKSSRVIGLADDIARSMSAIAARVAVVPGRNAIGIELPNANRETVYLREILSSQAYEKSKAKLPMILGKTIGGEATIADLAKMPHLLVAGTTGSGKSVAINTMILSILYQKTPEQVKMIMIDPKMLELSIYDGIPHLLTPVVTDPKKAVVALKWTVREMEDRYKKMSKVGVRNIDGFNSRIAQASKKGERITRTIQTGYDRDTGEAIYETEELNLEPMPYIVVIIDEMADLMMVAGKDIEGAIQRLAQMARAAGIHVIMATQRPSVDVITGTIKANFPTRISFQVTSKIDSRTILGEQGAEQLLGMGDMLYMAGGGRIQRVHGPFVADEEVDQVVQHLKSQGVPEYLDSVTEETEEDAGGDGGDTSGLAASNDIYDQAVAIVLKDRKASTSYVQRRLSIGYNRAASLIERMEQEGVISAANHAGKREILVPGEDETI